MISAIIKEYERHREILERESHSGELDQWEFARSLHQRAYQAMDKILALDLKADTFILLSTEEDTELIGPFSGEEEALDFAQTVHGKMVITTPTAP